MTDFIKDLKENMKKKMEDTPPCGDVCAHGGWLDLFDYKMYKEHWKQKGEYVINGKILFLLSPCVSCKCIVTEDNREYCEKFLSIKCLQCDKLSDMIQYLGFNCECSSAPWPSGCQSIATAYSQGHLNPVYESFENRLLWTIDKYNTGNSPGYTCNINDSHYLENKFSLEDLQKYGLEDEYLENEYNISYFFACFNCEGGRSDHFIKAEHIIFELGEDLCCPGCNKEFYFFKFLKKGPFKLPDIFYKLKKYNANKYPEIMDSSFCFMCKENFVNLDYKICRFSSNSNKDVFLCMDCSNKNNQESDEESDEESDKES